MNQQTYYYHDHSLKYNIRAVKSTERRIIRKNIETKYLFIGCQRYSEQTVLELALSSESITCIDMGNAGVLSGENLWHMYYWFSKL